MPLFLRRLALVVFGLGLAAAPVAAQERTPIAAAANDNRQRAGALDGDELRVELVAQRAEWRPRGAEGPAPMILAFAEEGAQPTVPGPLIRAEVGRPVAVTIRNTLDQPIAVRGLLDRASMEGGARLGVFPVFMSAPPLIVGPGERVETRFTPSAPVSSFYYAQLLPETVGDGPVRPIGPPGEGTFMGALIVDAAGTGPDPDERILMITRWSSPDEPGGFYSWKMMVNGQSWPFTERLEYTVGQEVHWRVVNTSAVDHPMHLHGFYFSVDAAGDAQADTLYDADDRVLAVTHLMEEFSSLRLTWIPERPGNWLFHCHLVRHMGDLQHFAEERSGMPHAASGPSEASMEDMAGMGPMDAMAGLITGIVVHPRPGEAEVDEAPRRTVHLWTGTKPDAFGEEPRLGFVLQRDAVPARDSTEVPGSAIVLTRGEPTQIVVHNRFDIPVSVHWHGLELRSLYDGVGGWSGESGSVRPPIAPGDSARYMITPPRSGSFMYHVHGEPGHELAQGLYGPFLVVDDASAHDTDADRTFMLGGYGATIDPAPAVNGRTRPGVERFVPGSTYRLRFLHMSPDAFKEVRLLRDGEPVRWRPVAKDGADLPAGRRAESDARVGLGVGETWDVLWTPDVPGLYVLEVATEFYPSRGGTVVQRIPFAVGAVADEALLLPQGDVLEEPEIPLDPEALERRSGVFEVGSSDPIAPGLRLMVWQEGGRLHFSPVSSPPLGPPSILVHVGGDEFPIVEEVGDLMALTRNVGTFTVGATRAEDRWVLTTPFAAFNALRMPDPRDPAGLLRPFEGRYEGDGAGAIVVEAGEGGLRFDPTAGSASWQALQRRSPTRFATPEGATLRFEFDPVSGRATEVRLERPDGSITTYRRSG